MSAYMRRTWFKGVGQSILGIPQRRGMKRSSTMALRIQSPSLKRIDMFRVREADVQNDTASLYSLFGTCVALGLLVFFSVQQLVTFSKHQATVRRSEADKPGLRAEMIPFGVLTFMEDELIFNESIFRWEFQYRVIFHGDARNDEFPRQYHNLPVKQCKTYFTIVEGVDPQPYTNVPYPTLDTGKDALCLDWVAAKEQLEEAGNPGLSSTIQLEGRYGDPAYWFLGAKLVPCSTYGAEENITCLTNEELEKQIFTKELAVDVIFLDNPEPGVFKWTSHYFNIDGHAENSHETYLKVIEYNDESKVLPSFLEPTLSKHVMMERVFVRRRGREHDDPYVNMYFRMSATVEVVEVSYFSLESALEGIGGWYSVLFFAFSIACLGPNLVLHLCRDAKRATSRLTHRISASSANAEDAENEGHEEEDTTAESPRSGASVETDERKKAEV
eukprot:Skav228064  [mRNA]  locus=scaffold2067:222896:224227:+ [translate_table: standard]